MNKEALKFEDVSALVDALAGCVQRWIDEAVSARGVAHLVLAGGSTPSALYAELVTRELPWSSLEIYFGDERCVPPEHEHSNFRAAQESLLSKVPVPPERIHRLQGETGARGAAGYEARLPERFDVTLLGMGEDGHTASLFPGEESLEASALVLYIDDSPKPPPERLTLGLRALNRSRHVAFMVTGSSKAKALAEVLHPTGELLPAARVNPEGSVTFFIDRAAAAELDRSET